MQELSASTNQLLLWVASISLLVGGIGVMNIMLVSVTERTGEIGLKKAVEPGRGGSSSSSSPNRQYLPAAGGSWGVMAGIILSRFIAGTSGTPAVISIPAAAASVGFSMLIGIVFGLLPSVKAANLNPIDALRRE